jgi:CRISPR-associated protein Csb2
MLILEIEYLTGVAVASSAYDRGRAEWPPHPDRVFSALVCAWAERGEDALERAALEWLETLGPPSIQAPEHWPRDVVDLFVPPNDMTVAGKLGAGMPKDASASLAMLPVLRKNRQARQFPAVALPDHDRRVRLIWADAGPAPVERHRPALARLASAVAYLGHSSSLVRIALDDGRAAPAPTHRPDAEGETLLRTPFAGRLRQLTEGYATAGERAWRPSRAPAVAYGKVGDAPLEAASSVFGRDWIVLADAGGSAPALEAFPIVAKTLRDALMTCADQPPPELLSGHGPDRAPTRMPHLAILPLADVGWTYSEGRLLGVALVLPRAIERERGDPARRATLQAIARFAAGDDGIGRLTLGTHGIWRLQRVAQPELHSLQPARYCRRSCRWATVTPMVLDRHPKPKPDRDLAAIVATACANIGLPPPVEIAPHQPSAIRGAPLVRRAPKDAGAAGFRLPRDSKLADRPLRHLVLRFAQPVAGPVVLGAGRFQGLGLCLPLDAGHVP